MSPRRLNSREVIATNSECDRHAGTEMGTAGVRLPWNTLRIVLLAAVASLGIFLYLTQQSLFDSVAAIAAAIPALIKLVSLIQRAPAGGANAD
jgi:hydrogenase/urease accessory protein HupE